MLNNLILDNTIFHAVLTLFSESAFYSNKQKQGFKLYVSLARSIIRPTRSSLIFGAFKSFIKRVCVAPYKNIVALSIIEIVPTRTSWKNRLKWFHTVQI